MTFKEFRRINGLKQSELVDMMNEAGVSISQPILSFIENNRMDPTVEMSAWLAGMTAEYNELTWKEDVILDAIAYATEPVTRAELHDATHLPDREIRKAIESLRCRGYWIIEDGKGYYLTNDVTEFKRWGAAYTAYARSILRTYTAMTRSIKQ